MPNGLPSIPATVAILCATIATAAQAQSQQTDDRFCRQYASSTAAIAQEAIDANPSCLDWSRGVHGNEQMHYSWCMQNSRDVVWGAADHIRNLAAQRMAPSGRQSSIYSEANGWTITALHENGRVVACEAMQLTGMEEGLYFYYDRNLSKLGFSGFASAASPFPIDVDMWFDGQVNSYASYQMELAQDNNGFDWRVLVQTNDEPSGELDAFSNLSSIHFGYDTGNGFRQMAFSLRGSNRAFKDTLACVQNAGQMPTAQPAARTGAKQNDYGGYDIAGSTLPSEEYTYASTRGWQVFAANDGSSLAYCVAEQRRDDGSTVRLGWDGMQWQVAVPINTKPDWQGVLEIDGAGSGRGYMNGGAYISGTANYGWAIAWLGEAELDGIRKGNNAVLGVEKFDYDFSLFGATAASLKVQECVQNSR